MRKCYEAEVSHTSAAAAMSQNAQLASLEQAQDDPQRMLKSVPDLPIRGR